MSLRPRSPRHGSSTSSRPEPTVGATPPTQEDLRSLRRWVLVAVVWAVAASAIAVIALLDARSNEDDKGTESIASQVTRIQRQLDSRLDEIEQRVDELPSDDDVQKLEDRLRQSEDDAQQAAADAERASSSLDDLEQRLEELEAGADSGGDLSP